MAPPLSLSLSSSVGMRVLVVVSPLLLVGLGGYGVLRGGWWSPGAVLLVGGLALGWGAARVLPWRCEMGPDGVLVASLAGERRFDWDDVVAVERQRGRKGGPLVLRTIEHGKVALSDVAERPAEWDALREVLDRFAPGTAVPEPPPGHPFRSGG